MNQSNSCPSCKSTFAVFRSTRRNGRAGSSKLPLVLKCGHTFCEDCLAEKSVKKKNDTPGRQITCFICKQITSVQNGVKDLCSNLYLLGQLEMDQLSKLDQTLGQFIPDAFLSKPPKIVASGILVKNCSVCKTSDATCKCVECDNMMCNNCFETFHKMSAAIKQHKPIPLPSIKNGDECLEQTCKEHNKLIEYLCVDDGTSICSRCAIKGDHIGHNIMSYEEKNKAVMADIEAETEKAQKIFYHLERADEKLSSSVPKVQQQMKKTIMKVKESFLCLHTQLQVREMELMESLNQMAKDMSTTINEHRESYAIKRFNVDETLKKAKKLIENNALVIDSTKLLDKLKATQEIPCLVVKKQESDKDPTFLWTETCKNELLQAVQSFGNVTGDALNNIEFLTLDDAPPGYETDVDDKISVVSSVSMKSQSRQPQSRKASTVASIADSSESVLIEYDNSDADSDASRVSKNKRPAASALPKQSQQESLVLPILKGRPQKATVTHISSPQEFKMQLNENKRKLGNLSYNMNTWCRRETSSRHTPNKVEVGDFVVARYSADKTWYRAKVVGLEGVAEEDANLKVHVLYIDFGNEETLPMKELRNMEKRFMIYPSFAVQCCLDDIAPYHEHKPWSTEAIQDFTRMTENKVLLLSVKSEEKGVYHVDLVCTPHEDVLDDGYVSVRDMLVFLGAARFNVHSDEVKHSTTRASYRKVSFIKPSALKSGITVEMIVSSVESPSSFYIQCYGEERAYYTNMFDDMQDMYGGDSSNMYSLYYPVMDTCCSVLAKDGFWYRGQVVSPPKHRKVTAYLVDTGLTVTVGMECLKKLHNKFVKLPQQAVHCSLADVTRTVEDGDDWSVEAKHWAKKTMKKAVGLARVKRWDNPAEIVLWLGSRVSVSTSSSVNYLLVALGFARSTGLSSVGTAQDLLYQSGPDNDAQSSRYAFTASTSDRIKKISAGYRDLISYSSARTFEDISGYSSSSDNQSNAEAQVSRCSPQGKGSPKRSAGCSHQQQQESTRDSPEKAKHSYAPYKERKYKQSTVVNVTSQKQKEERRAKIAKEKVQKDIQRAISDEGSSTDTGSEFIEVIISAYESPANFTLRIKENEPRLESLMEKLQEYEDTPPSEDCRWKAGDFCTAKKPVDGLWYRGKIVNCQEDGTFLVDLVDYGYVEVFQNANLRSISQEMRTFMEVAAVRCHIANLIPAGSIDVSKWSRTGIEFMKSETKDRTLFVKQEADINDLGLPIDLIIETEYPETAFEPAIKMYSSLRKKILDEGLAMPNKKQSGSAQAESIDPFQRFIFEQKCGLVDVPADSEGSVCETNTSEATLRGGISSSAATHVEASCSDSAGRTQTEPIEIEHLVLLPSPALGSESLVDVFPTYVDYEGIAYVQPKAWEHTVIHVDCELQRIYGSRVSSAPNVNWQENQLCVAYFPDDDRWYRARIKELLDDGSVQVIYIDYGNCAVVPKNCLRIMLPEFANIHCLSCQCVLHDIAPDSDDGKWQMGVLEYLHGLLVNAWCKMAVVEEKDDKPLQVTFTIEGEHDVAALMVEQGLVLILSDMTEEYERSALISRVLSQSCSFQTVDVGGPGDTFCAILTSVELPNLVHLQLVRKPDLDTMDFVKSSEIARINSMLDDFDDMTERLNSSNLMPFPHLPSVGTICAVQFDYDNRWYRALNICSYPSKNKCLVLYVDFGNSEEVPLDKIRALPSQFWSVPMQALRVYYNIVPPAGPSGRWTRKSVNAVLEALGNKEIIVRIKQTKPLTAELLTEGETGEMRLAYESVIEKGQALLPESIESWQLYPLQDGDDDGVDVIVEGREDEENRNQSNYVSVDERSGSASEKEKTDWWSVQESYMNPCPGAFEPTAVCDDIKATTTEVGKSGDVDGDDEDGDDDDDGNSEDWITDDDGEEDDDDDDDEEEEIDGDGDGAAVEGKGNVVG